MTIARTILRIGVSVFSILLAMLTGGDPDPPDREGPDPCVRVPFPRCVRESTVDRRNDREGYAADFYRSGGGFLVSVRDAESGDRGAVYRRRDRGELAFDDRSSVYRRGEYDPEPDWRDGGRGGLGRDSRTVESVPEPERDDYRDSSELCRAEIGRAHV